MKSFVGALFYTKRRVRVAILETYFSSSNSHREMVRKPGEHQRRKQTYLDYLAFGGISWTLQHSPQFVTVYFLFLFIYSYVVTMFLYCIFYNNSNHMIHQIVVKLSPH